MRTTVDLPEDLHALVRQLAHDDNRSLSDVIATLVRAGMTGRIETPERGPRGLPLVSVGHPVSSEDVARSDDE